MNTVRELMKAKLIEIIWNSSGQAEVKSGGNEVTVQFNPASLKVAFTNQVQTNDQSTNSAIQFVGRGSSKLTLELIFDISTYRGGADSGNGDTGTTAPTDVRELTDKVARFMKPEEEAEGEETRYIPPGVRFSWGSFLFDGIVESMDETLDLWSEDGRPLRATVALGLSQQGIFIKTNDNPAATPPPETSNTAPAGTKPMQAAKSGDSVQRMATQVGKANSWKQIAQANGIENPRNLAPGTLVDLRPKTTSGAE